MAPKVTRHIQTNRTEKTRIGPLTIITLITIICMAVLAVLAASTSTATATISNRQAHGTQFLYVNERAGQEFVAGVDEALASARAAGGGASMGGGMVERNLDAICEKARAAGGEDISCTARVDGTNVTAEFICANARRLDVAITIQRDATYKISQWKMASAAQDTQAGGNLWTGE